MNKVVLDFARTISIACGLRPKLYYSSTKQAIASTWRSTILFKDLAVFRRLIPGAVWSFNSRVCQNSNSQSKYSHSQSTYSKCKFKSNHNSDAFLVSLQLENQQLKVDNKPNVNTNTLLISRLAKKGPITKPAKKTWPALSNILANLNSSSSVKTGSFGNSDSIISTLPNLNQLVNSILSVIQSAEQGVFRAAKNIKLDPSAFSLRMTRKGFNYV